MKRLIILVSLLLSLCCTALAGQVTVTGVGMTEAEAQRDALRNAVEQAVGVLVDSQTLVQKSAVVEDKIYANAQGFVSSFEVLNKQQRADGWQVTLRAVVDDSADSQLISTLERYQIVDVLLRDPKIAVMIPETHLTARIPDPAGETAVIKKLKECGFDNLVDISKERMLYNNPYNLGEEELQSLANSMQADILVVGEAFSESLGDVGKFLPKNKRTNVISCRARVEAKMYVARSGRIIAADGVYGSAVDPSEAIASKMALANAGEKMGKYLADELLKFARGNRKHMELVVLTANFENINKVKAALGGIRGVNNAQLNNYSNSRATFTLLYGGAPEALFNELQQSLDVDVTLRSQSYDTLMVMIR